MEIRKERSDVLRHSASPEDMVLINRLTRAELQPEQVYTFALRLCYNEIDRDWERFDEHALETLSGLFAGKSGIFDHHWSAQGQTARLYRTQVCQEEGLTAAGDGCRFLKGYAYMLRSEKNDPLIQEIEAGIKKEVSIGCSVASRRCSICGRDGCEHQGGQRYGGKLCYFTLREPTDAYEWSFVAVPAQRKAGVIKGLARPPAGDLRRLLSGHPEHLRQLEALEKQARLGRSYIDGLRRELVRLAGLADESLDLKLFAGAAEKLEEDELLELTRAYRRRMEERFPPVPQLLSASAAKKSDEDRAFLV